MIHSTHISNVLSRIPPEFNSLKGWFIAGGSASTSSYSDIDIYFESEQAYLDAKSKFQIEFSTSNADTFTYTKPSNSPFSSNYPISIQLVHKSFGSPLKILSDFDLNVCRNAILPDGSYFQHQTSCKPLYLDISQIRANSVNRFIRYLNRGFYPDFSKLHALVHTLAANPAQIAPHPYDSEFTVDYANLLFRLTSEANLATHILQIIDQLPNRSDLFSTLIKPDSEYYPHPTYSEELQLLLSTSNPHLATPLIKSNYPELFI